MTSKQRGCRLLPADQSTVSTRDGRDLAVAASGPAGDPVVLEAGLGMSSSSWYGVFTRLAAHTRVLAYDRSGLGASPNDPAPRTLTRMVDDLEDVVRATCSEPVILVGHSLGGPIARACAMRHPELVAGLVLCDPAQEQAPLYQGRRFSFLTRVGYPAMTLVARTGIASTLIKKSVSGLEGLPDGLRQAVTAEMGSVAQFQTAAREAAHVGVSLAAFREDVAGAPRLAIPVTVISGTRSSRAAARTRTQLNDYHQKFCTQLPQGRWVGASQAAHMVQLESPDLVTDEILHMIASTRSARTAKP